MKTTLKKILNLIWKVGLGLLGLTAACIGILDATVWHENRYGSAMWKDHALSKDIVVKGFNDNTVRVWSNKSASYTTPKLRWVSSRPERDSVTVYSDRVSGYRGYINCNTGRITLPADKMGFRRAWHFSEGRAFVVLNHEDRLSIIDYDGNIISHGIAPYEEGYDHVFIDGYCLLAADNGKYGLLAKDGSWAMEPNYSDIRCPNADGYRIAINNEGFWLFDKSLNKVFENPYDDIDYAIGRDEGTLYLSHNHTKQLVNYDGTVVEPFVIDGTYELRYMTRYQPDQSDEYEIVPDIVAYRVGRWEGLMDKRSGKTITGADYTDFTMISKDLIRAELCLSYEDQSIVLDKRGNVVRQ